MIYLKTFEFYRNDLLQKFKNNKWTYSDLLNKEEEHIYTEECIGNYLKLEVDKNFNYITDIVYKKDYIHVLYVDCSEYEIQYHIKNNELDGFLRYLNNPETYVDSKKYNL